MLQDRTSKVAILVLAMTTEPLRFLSAYFMRSALRFEDPCMLPRQLDLWQPRRSPITSALQYFSTLLAGSNRRTLFLSRTADCSSYLQWCEHRKDELRTLRRSVVVVICWVHQRFARRLMAWPWQLISLGDPKRKRVTRYNKYNYIHIID